MYAIGELSLGNYGWANIPKAAVFDDQGVVTKILNKNPAITERMYFGLVFPGGREAFSWHLGAGTLGAMYQNINFISFRGQSTAFYCYFNKTYNVDYFKRSR